MTLPEQFPDSSQIRHGAGTVAEALGEGTNLKVTETIVTLKAVSASGRAGAIFVLEPATGIYAWEATNASAESLPTVVQPADLPATGRWVRRIASV